MSNPINTLRGLRRWRMTETGRASHALTRDGKASYCGIPEARLRARAVVDPRTKAKTLHLGCCRCYGLLAVELEWMSIRATSRERMKLTPAAQRLVA